LWTIEQVRDPELDLDCLAIAVKPSDSRAKKYIAEYGDRCWEVDVLPPDRIGAALDSHVNSWLDRAAWDRRHREPEPARSLLRAAAVPAASFHRACASRTVAPTSPPTIHDRSCLHSLAESLDIFVPHVAQRDLH
jgi:hypothetical protein